MGPIGVHREGIRNYIQKSGTRHGRAALVKPQPMQRTGVVAVFRLRYTTQLMTLITDTAALARFCAEQRGTSFVAVDTEFMRERTYWPILCLVQVAGPTEAAAIDALSPGIDLTPLLALMADESILKVFHAARQDVEIFYNLS